MSCKDVQQGAIGVVFVLELVDCNGTVIDLSDATTVEMLFRAPNGVLLTKTATMVAPGSLGRIQYTTIANDLAHTGKWTRQARVVWPSGKDIRSSVVGFNVRPNV